MIREKSNLYNGGDTMDKVKIVSLVLSGLGIVAGLIGNWVDGKNQEKMAAMIADMVAERLSK